MGFTMVMNQGTCDGLGLRKALLSRQLYSKAQPSMAHGYPWHSAMLGKNLEPKAHGMWAMPVLEKTLAARPQKKKSRGRCGHKTWIIPAILGLCSWCLNISQSIHIHSDFQVILGLCSRSFELPTPILRSRYWRPVADFINMADVQADVAPPSGDSEILRIESST